MKITQITIQQTKQVAQYEPLVISATVDLDDTDNVNEAIDELKTYVRFKLCEDANESRAEKDEAFAEKYNEAKREILDAKWLNIK